MRTGKVAILTQPLGGNYGGMLQAYALQSTLSRLGHDVITNDHSPINVMSIRRVLGRSKRYVLGFTLHKKAPFVHTPHVVAIITKRARRFVENNISTLNLHNNKNNPDKTVFKKFDAFVVGSDQVWRKRYSNIPIHMLDFTKGMDVKRISYAASFGTDDLSEYGPRLIKKSAKLAQKFDAMSVREDSGVDICRKYWGVEAEHHVDPTLLLSKDDYVKLVDEDAANVKESAGNMFVYVLDKSDDKGKIADKVASKLKLKPFEIMPEKPMSRKEFYVNPDKYVLPPVTQWLRSFMDAKFVVTDSFHGCVFSIIFNKPFIAIGNKARGMARFTSLLKMFGLEDRLVGNVDDITPELIETKIDWKRVNDKIDFEKGRSMEYLRKNLGD
jgi:hypothetical protein